MRTAIQDDREARLIVESGMGVKIFEPFSGLVFFDGTKVIGAAVFNNYTGRDVYFSAASTGSNGLHRDLEFAEEVARYVFQTLGCHRVTAITRRSNLRAIKALESLGFIREGVLREHFPDSDGIIFGLLRSEQWLLKDAR